MMYSSRSDAGLVRAINEDCVEILEISESVIIATLCDGMGGANCGEIASATAVGKYNERLVSLYSERLDNDAPDMFEVRRCMECALDDANRAVYKKSVENPECDGMGTTLVSCIICRGCAYIVNVGDSRAYIVSDGRMRRLTHDHTYIYEQSEMGTYDERQGEIFKHCITRAVGVGLNPKGDYFMVRLKKGDRILLMSDGVWGELNDSIIEHIAVSARSCAECAEMLSDTVLSGKAEDNISVIAIDNI